MYCNLQHKSQFGYFSQYVPKGYIRVPSSLYYWRSHMFSIQNLMPSSFRRSLISLRIISKPKDVGSTPQFTSYQLTFNMPWWVLLWVVQPFKYNYFNDYHLQLPPISPHQDPCEALCVDLIGSYTLKGQAGSVLDSMCLTVIDPATGWFEMVELPIIYH